MWPKIKNQINDPGLSLSTYLLIMKIHVALPLKSIIQNCNKCLKKPIYESKQILKKNTIGIITQCRCLKRLIGQYFCFVIVVVSVYYGLARKKPVEWAMWNNVRSNDNQQQQQQKINIIKYWDINVIFFFFHCCCHSHNSL